MPAGSAADAQSPDIMYARVTAKIARKEFSQRRGGSRANRWQLRADYCLFEATV